MNRTWTIDSPARHDVGGVADPVRRVAVTLVSGHVDVVARGGDGSVACEVHAVDGPALTASYEDGHLRVEHHKDESGQLFGGFKNLFAGRIRRSARITLTVPPHVAVTVRTADGNVLIGGVTGDVSIITASGRVRLAATGGRVDVKTVSGAIEGHALAGELRTTTASGAVTLDDSRPRTVKIGTVSGGVALDLRSMSTLVTVNSGSGDVTVRLPHRCGYDVTATSTSGHVVVDGHTLSGGESGEKGGHRSDGDRGVAVKARAMSGNVVVLRADAASDVPAFHATHPAAVQDVRPLDRAAERAAAAADDPVTPPPPPADVQDVDAWDGR